MIQHIVLYKLKSDLDGDQKAALIKEIQHEFSSLANEIPELRILNVRPNFNPQEEYDFMLLAKLENKKDLCTYSEHPSHKALVERLLTPNVASRAAVDVWNELEIKGNNHNPN